jgi:hypothetical protein
MSAAVGGLSWSALTHGVYNTSAGYVIWGISTDNHRLSFTLPTMTPGTYDLAGTTVKATYGSVGDTTTEEFKATSGTLVISTWTTDQCNGSCVFVGTNTLGKTVTVTDCKFSITKGVSGGSDFPPAPPY